MVKISRKGFVSHILIISLSTIKSSTSSQTPAVGGEQEAEATTYRELDCFQTIVEGFSNTGIPGVACHPDLTFRREIITPIIV